MSLLRMSSILPQTSSILLKTRTRLTNSLSSNLTCLRNLSRSSPLKFFSKTFATTRLAIIKSAVRKSLSSTNELTSCMPTRRSSLRSSKSTLTGSSKNLSWPHRLRHSQESSPLTCPSTTNWSTSMLTELWPHTRMLLLSSKGKLRLLRMLAHSTWPGTLNSLNLLPQQCIEQMKRLWNIKEAKFV